MTDTIFTKVDYDLGSLIKYIELGEIGLPDIQRPFVWKNAKVRDLFDSMYRGYPVGYFLFWQNGLASQRTIGAESKQKVPRLVIVDGQQRLTSLYAVIRGVPVVRSNYSKERICIAFNPLEERFAVTDAAIRRDKSYIPDISVLWKKDTNMFAVADNFLQGLRSTREVSNEETMRIQNAISKLQSLLSFPFTAVELAAHISEQDVSDVFVRINSKGKPLNQSDFILTLMSVFWDDGRMELERFCEAARRPSRDEASPFNYFIEPRPDQLLRVSVGVAFKRARLQHVYSLLRGKDLETGEFSEERREQQFDKLKEAQEKTLNLSYWHDFMTCLRHAGFRSKKMITSESAIVFSYVLYLIGRTEYRVEPAELRQAIAQWFFMSTLTGRYSSSPESTMEYDLARLRIAKNAEDYLKQLRHVCDVTLTSDFWTVTLPNDLATSTSRSPTLFAYLAALVLLDAPVLFSNVKVGDAFDPAIRGSRNSVERHHLFPKQYLARIGITDRREVNQIANYAIVEWGDNSKISDQAPEVYVPQMKARFSDAELRKMYYYHALPNDWERLPYRDFLEKRRELMAQVVRDGYQTLLTGPTTDEHFEEDFLLNDLVKAGESEVVEYKSTLRVNLHTQELDKRIEMSVLKTIAAFLNTAGGTLIIGIADDGTPVGIEVDRFENEDKMALHLVNVVKARLGPNVLTAMNIQFDDYQGKRVMVVRCHPFDSPVFVKDGDTERFYIRTGPATTELTPSQTQQFIKRRFK